MKYYKIIIGLFLLSFSVFANYKMDFAKAGFIEDISEEFVWLGMEEPVREWTGVLYYDFVSSFGDYFMVDVTSGLGYLMNDFTRFYTVFPVMTGAVRTPTPYKEWVVLDKNIQTNRVVFSESGEFFRMYEGGTKRTSYGIHGYGYFDQEMRRGTKFLSLGCILVADDVLDIIEESYIVNGNSLNVSTRENINLLSYFEEISG